jgi:glutaredoxin
MRLLTSSLLLLVVFAGGCRKSTPDAPAQAASLPPLEVSREGKWLFTYLDPKGEFATTDDPKAIPAGAQRVVRVVDPARAAQERRDVVRVYVVDVSEVLKAGKAQAKELSREAFETGAMAQLPPGESSVWPRTSGGVAPAPDEPPPAASPASAGAPVVTIYGTSWCGACKAARQYLSARKIPFADKDIERDAEAARELQTKATRLGVPADRVPILDVRGRLLVGFDKARLEALLGEAT